MTEGIYERKTELIFPSSSGGTTTIIHPFLGPADYETLFSEKNFQEDLKQPTGIDNADFLHAIYCGPEEFKNNPKAQEAQDKMESLWLYVPVINIWTPQGFKVNGQDRHGVYSVVDKEGQGKNLEFNQKSLEKTLNRGEKLNSGIILGNRVSFAPRDTYSIGEQTPEELRNNGLVIATYTKKGAQRLAEVSQKFNSNTFLWGIDNPDGIVKGVSALGSSNGLDISGSNADYDNAFSFGVRRSSVEGTRA